jgi:hypothetical protein
MPVRANLEGRYAGKLSASITLSTQPSEHYCGHVDRSRERAGSMKPDKGALTPIAAGFSRWNAMIRRIASGSWMS